MTTPVITSILAGALDAELEDWGPLEEATGAPMATHGVELCADGDQSAGIWQCAQGPSHWIGWKGTWDIHETVRKVYSIF